MDEQQNELKNRVEDKLQQKIIDLEAVQLALDEDLRVPTDEETRKKNEELLAATEDLIGQLKQAYANIRALTVGDQRL